jgi:hypothetical protein
MNFLQEVPCQGAHHALLVGGVTRDLAIPGAIDQFLGQKVIGRRTHHDNFVNLRMLLERVKRIFQHRLSGELHELLPCFRSEAGVGPAEAKMI